MDDEVEEAGSAATSAGIVCDAAGVIDAGAVDVGNTPGGGDATTSGSSISSSGKSGSCSSNGEGDTLAKSFGAAGLAAVEDAETVDAGAIVAEVPTVADGAYDAAGTCGADSKCSAEGTGDGNGPCDTAEPGDANGACGAAGTCDANGACGAAGARNADDAADADGTCVAPRGTDAAGVCAAPGACDPSNAPCDPVVTPLPGLPPEAGVGTTEALDGPFTVGAEVGVAPTEGVPAADLLTDTPAAVGGVGGFAVGEPPPGVTPTGLEIFLAPCVPILPAESELGVVRGAAAPEILEAPAAPIETPTGREAAAGGLPDGGDGMLGL